MREAQTNDSAAPVDDEDKIEAIADDAIYLAQKLERNLTKISKAGGEVTSSTQEEIESLRKSLRKARSDLETAEEELQQLRGTTRSDTRPF
jgi:DNA repair exonuclease SbcCD ATPase subunit